MVVVVAIVCSHQCVFICSRFKFNLDQRSSFVSLLRPIGETEVFAGSVALPSVGKGESTIDCFTSR